MRMCRPLLLAILCIALSNPAEARPRIFRMLGLLAAPLGVIAGAAHSRRHHHYVRSSTRDNRQVSTGKTVALADWAGPLYWPYAADDLFGYVFGGTGPDARFWAHGYGDVLDGMFVTASISDEKVRKAPPTMQSAENGSSAATAAPGWQAMCGSESADAGNGLIERVRNVVEPTSEQAGALESLQKSLNQAFRRIQAACPSALLTTGTERLDHMSARLLAMRQAAILVLTPLRKFYASLSNEQKSRLNAPPTDQADDSGAPSARAMNGPGHCVDANASMDWPTAQIARRLAPTREQFAGLEMLRQTSAYLSQFVARSCVANSPQSPPERLDAALKRINILRYAATHVSPALDEVYYSLSPRQKARFAALGR